ncbi:uncharacterized protein LOC127590362 [Hippocampus zosterae]|uniref:uncharacterized protein LOC127590362 n=1 Tax=Hippocampus zosterae TaxID=109293 RepID=UPI00223DC516|nr:uncharacterized protein LOC127590362 [Hippocampus zosterae]
MQSGHGRRHAPVGTLPVATMFCVVVLALLATVSSVKCEQLTQLPSLTLQSGGDLTITCQVSYDLDDYYTAWVRQAAGKGLEWIGRRAQHGIYHLKNSLSSKFSIELNPFNRTVTLNGQNMQPEDTAVYYCAREFTQCDRAFDYWGKGTQVTVTGGTPIKPTLFPLMQCGSGATLSLGCLATGFTPSPLTFTWSKDGNALTDFIQYPSVENNNLYTGVSQIQVRKVDWDNKAEYRCVAENSNANVELTITKTEEAFSLPTVKVLAAPDGQDEASFACFAKDFSPNVYGFKWLLNGYDVSNKMDEIKTHSEARSGPDGTTLYSAASFLTLEPNQLSPDANITCEFKGRDAHGDIFVSAYFAQNCNPNSSVTTDVTFPDVDVNVKIVGPTPDEMFLQRQGTVICEVKINKPSVKSISWENQDGKKMADTLISLQSGQTGVFRSLLELTYDEWINTERRNCVVLRTDTGSAMKVSYQRYAGQPPRRPTLFMMAPLEDIQTKTVTLTCFAKDFFPRDVLLRWLVNDEPVGPTYIHRTTNPLENQGSYSVYGQLTISLEEWEKLNLVYSCMLYHKSLSSTSNVIVRAITHTSGGSNAANFRITDPELCKTHWNWNLSQVSAVSTVLPDIAPDLTLYPLLEDEFGAPTIKLLCIINGFFPDTLSIEWLRDNRKVAAARTTTRKYQRVAEEAQTFTLLSEFEPTAGEWKSGSDFTCKSIQNEKEMIKSISICETPANDPPSVHVELPGFKAVMTETSDVTAVCTVRTALDVVVTMLAEGKTATYNQTGQYNNASHVVSNLTVSADEWKQMKSVKCKAEHRCFSDVEEIIAVSEPAANAPSVAIRRSLGERQKDDAAVFECDVTQLDAVDLYVTLQADAVDISDKRYVALSKLPGPHSISLYFSVPKSFVKHDSRFTCKVNQGFSGIFHSKPIDNVFAEPSMELFLAPGEEESKPQRLLCSGWGFNPRIKWYTGSQQRTPSTNDISMSADGRVAVASRVDIEQEEWQTGKKFTCEVSDRWLNKNVTKTINVCSVIPPSAQKVAVYIQGPPLTESQQRDQVTVTCLVIGVRLDDFAISWKVDGKKYFHDSHTEKPTSHDNGTQSLRSFLDVLASDWDAYKQVSCEGKHKCSNRGYEGRVSKSKDSHPPTVRIVPPTISELSTSNNLTLTCLVSGFFPDNKIAHWEKDGQRLPTSSYTNSPSWIDSSGSGTFSMLSRLDVSKSEDRGARYSCCVKHESSETPVRSTIENVFAPVTPSRPSAVLLRGSGELVCLVFGFSPASINISWYLDDANELSYFNTSQPSRGPDGKFSIQSRLRLSQIDLLPGVVHTCRVTHATLTLTLNVTNPVILPDCNVLDDIADAVVNQDINVESWYMSATFLALFLISIVYGVLATLVKTK